MKLYVVNDFATMQARNIKEPTWRMHAIIKTISIFGLLIDALFGLVLQSVFSTILFQVDHFHEQIAKYYAGPRRELEHIYFAISVLLVFGSVAIALTTKRQLILFQFILLKVVFIVELFIFWWAFTPWFKVSIFVGR